MSEASFRNQKSAKQLIIEQQSLLDIKPSKKNPGVLFFTCGKITGYVAKAAAKELDTLSLDELQYSECLQKGSGEWVPVISKMGIEPIKSFGAELLHH